MQIAYILNFFSDISRRNDIHGSIAHSICSKMRDISNYSIESLARLCAVSPASVSRFAKALDYENYNAFVTSLKTANHAYRLGGNNVVNRPDTDYFLFHQEQAAHCREQFAKLDLVNLRRELLASNKVILAGSPKPDATTILQMEMNFRKIDCTNYFSPEDQYIELAESQEDAFIVAYDCFTTDSILPYLMKPGKKLNGLLITCNPAVSKDSAKYVLRLRDINFPANLEAANLVTYALINEIQKVGRNGL